MSDPFDELKAMAEVPPRLLRLGELHGAAEFDKVFDRLLELVNDALDEGRDPWEPKADYRPGVGRDPPSQLTVKQRYFFDLLHWFIDGQRRLGVTDDPERSSQELLAEWRARTDTDEGQAGA